MSVVEKNREMSDEMLVKYLVGETDGPEGELVKAWLNESSENRKYFYDFKMVWNVSGKIKHGPVFSRGSLRRLRR